MFLAEGTDRIVVTEGEVAVGIHRRNATSEALARRLAESAPDVEGPP